MRQFGWLSAVLLLGVVVCGLALALRQGLPVINAGMTRREGRRCGATENVDDAQAFRLRHADAGRA